MKNKKESFFWTSYSDLMTTMFFIMLVLFVLVVTLMHSKVVATEDQLDQIRKLNNSIEQIDSTYFDFDQDFKRHTLKDVSVSFKRGSSNISDIDPISLDKLEKAGVAIRSFMLRTQKDIPDAQYLLIVEGQSSKDDWLGNDELSYRRALALVKYWNAMGIRFDDLPCELIVSGSGQSSRFRVFPDISTNVDNQRFVIHIIPKPGRI